MIHGRPVGDLSFPSPAAMSDDGYVKYVCYHTMDAAPGHPDLPALDALRTALFDASLVGMNANGVGFGNLSIRASAGSHGSQPDAFIITATGTGGARDLNADGYCLVTSCLPAENYVHSRGPLQASSEAMTHAAVYAASPSTRCVAHIHSRELFDRLLAEYAPATPSDAAFGTPALAQAVEALVRQWPQEGVLVLSGHDEGLVAYGPSVSVVAELLAFLQRTYLSSSCPCTRKEHAS